MLIDRIQNKRAGKEGGRQKETIDRLSTIQLNSTNQKPT